MRERIRGTHSLGYGDSNRYHIVFDWNGEGARAAPVYAFS
jgi:hypothetical protein